MRAKEVGGVISVQLGALNEANCDPIRLALDNANSRSDDIRRIRDIFFISPAFIMPIINFQDQRLERFTESATIVFAYVGLRFLESRINRSRADLEAQLNQTHEDLGWVGDYTGEFIGKVRDSNRRTVQNIWPGIGVSGDLRHSLDQVTEWSTKKVCDPSGEYVIALGRTSDAEDNKSGLKIVYDVGRKVPVMARIDWDMRGEPQSTALIFSNSSNVDETIRNRVSTGEEIAYVDEVFGDVRALDVRQAGKMRFGGVQMTCLYAHKIALPASQRTTLILNNAIPMSEPEIPGIRRSKRSRSESSEQVQENGEVQIFPPYALSLLDRGRVGKDVDKGSQVLEALVQRRVVDRVKMIVGRIEAYGGMVDTGIMMPTKMNSYLHLPRRENKLFQGSTYFGELARMGLALMPGGKDNDHHKKLNHAGGLLFALLFDGRIRPQIGVGGGTVRMQCDYLRKVVMAQLYDLLQQQRNRHESGKHFDEILVSYLSVVLGQLEQ